MALVIIPVLVVIITFIKTGGSYFTTLFMQKIIIRISTDMKMRLYAHLIKSDIAVYNRKSSGVMISSMTNDVKVIMSAVNAILNGLVRQTITVVSLVGVMFILNWQLSIIALLGFPFAAYPIVVITRKLKKLTRKNQSFLGDFTSKMDDTLKSARLVKSYNAENFEIKRMNGILDVMYRIAIKMNRVSLLSSPLVETIGGFGAAFVIWYGGYQVIEGISTQGAFFYFFGSNDGGL